MEKSDIDRAILEAVGDIPEAAKETVIAETQQAAQAQETKQEAGVLTR